ncbi:hypothetical protein V8G54_028069 [Vigna mungo]|uniref:Uncharacterized protein n=1 Tax=Vigna mungo TaxID=3915 RepID=A0AAQ3MS25_VIGMU
MAEASACCRGRCARLKIHTKAAFTTSFASLLLRQPKTIVIDFKIFHIPLQLLFFPLTESSSPSSAAGNIVAGPLRLCLFLMSLSSISVVPDNLDIPNINKNHRDLVVHLTRDTFPVDV